MAKLIYAPEARLEIKEAAAYYEGCKEGLGNIHVSPFTTITFKKISHFLINTSIFNKLLRQNRIE